MKTIENLNYKILIHYFYSKSLFMSEKIRVRTRETGIIRWVTVAGYELAHGKYELLDQQDIESLPPDNAKKNDNPDAKVAADEEIERVRNEYQAFIGAAPDKRKGVDTLKAEIEDFKNQNS